MDYEKIYKILIEIVADQNNVIIESKLKKKEGSQWQKKNSLKTKLSVG